MISFSVGIKNCPKEYTYWTAIWTTSSGIEHKDWVSLETHLRFTGVPTAGNLDIWAHTEISSLFLNGEQRWRQIEDGSYLVWDCVQNRFEVMESEPTTIWPWIVFAGIGLLYLRMRRK